MNQSDTAPANDKMKIYAESNVLSKRKASKLKEPRRVQGSSSSSHMDSDQEYFCTKESAKRSVKYYLQNTTLHGLKYIAEEKITLPERIFFGLSFVFVVILSAFFISKVYNKWSATPIIISTSAKQKLTTDVPFPAITICNLNQALKSRVKLIERSSTNYTLLMSLCDQSGDMAISYTGTWKYFKEILIEVAQPCDQMLLYCRFGAIPENCSLIFNSVLTDDGLCCTFNALDPIFLFRNYTDDVRLSPPLDTHYKPIDWTPERGYGRGALPQHFFPRVAGGTGSRMGLTVVLNVSTAEYYCTKSMSVGFKVLVHNPAELPKVSNYGFLVTAGREARIPIEPIYEDAMPSVRSIKKSVRRCLFSDEGDLVFYRTYSRKNCELECEAKILMRVCNCVLYYLPRIDAAARICGPNDNACTNQVQTEIESSSNNLSCDSCWPACHELTYRASLSSSTIVYGSFQSIDEFPNRLFTASDEVADLSILNFYYISNIFRATTKSEMFGFTEFLSNTGGLLGLFMGFSIFSLIEIVYYITVRPYCAGRTSTQRPHRRQHAKAQWITPVRGSKPPPAYNQIARMQPPRRRRLKHSLWQRLLHQREPNMVDTPIYPYLE